MSDNKIRRFATRTLKDVPLTFENEDGDRITEKFTVVYRSFSKKTREEVNSEDGMPFADLLSRMVVSITDRENRPLTDDRGGPADLAGGFFETMAIEDAGELYNRIHDDIFPPKASPESGPSGSVPAASEA